jgi:beta-galactosidase
MRQDILLNSSWQSVADEHANTYNGFEKSTFNTNGWQNINVPHNWDQYEGYRRLKHGNRHGYAWYRKSFTIIKSSQQKQYFLFFEGVGSYATVWLNGKQVGYHAGGRTTFTLNVTNDIYFDKSNLLAVRADHPAFINDLPWVCGGCSDEVGFSEGSQPMGIFRPVHLIVTAPVRVEPFGVHIWNDTTVTERSADLHLEAEIKNYSNHEQTVKVINRITDATGKTIKTALVTKILGSGVSIVESHLFKLQHVRLWCLKQPYLYKITTEVWQNNQLLDREVTPYGIRWISWPINRPGSNKQFLLNGKPVFINGIAEYEHLMGTSHAFTHQQIHTRVMQVKAAGFNAFRDAHQPHNLAYQQYWDQLGILWWPQFTAHIWFDSPAFRQNFKQLLTDWVKERRNSPSVILWGLQNESKLPTDFARECTALIRKLDPTASKQRKITTCNGGTGTDWDVPQNWTGTYGGDPQNYGSDLQKQLLVGEYGAWRSIDLHTEGPFAANGILSEDRLNQLMETKIKLAEQVKDKTAGHFQWLLYSHENPGRVQGGEGTREIDRVGPVNYKGLFTIWGEPTDAFYLYRANYAPKDKEPMVYIVSHSWPDRWLLPGKKDGICVYSNCDEVDLFNDVTGHSLGKRKQQGVGTHFQWDGADIRYNILSAVGYVNGKKVATDRIVLNHLPEAPGLKVLKNSNQDILKPAQGYRYLYRLNCGGPQYKDSGGNLWADDEHLDSENEYGSTSWTDRFDGMPAMFGSQRRIFDAINGTHDWPLFQTFRYGQSQLKYSFNVPDGYYLVELYFIEPWYGNSLMNCAGWRLFDVAVNNKTVINNLDIWKEAGYQSALKKSVKVYVTGGKLVVSFPNTSSGEAVISAIAIAAARPVALSNKQLHHLITDLKVANAKPASQWQVKTWLDEGDKLYTGGNTEISHLPASLFGAEWIQTSKQTTASATFKTASDAEVFIALDGQITSLPVWMAAYNDTKTPMQTDEGGGQWFKIYKRNFKKGTLINLGINPLNAAMYMVAALPATHMEPATDLKPTISYKPEVAIITGGGAVLDSLNGKQCITFKSNTNAVVEWPFSVGVADIYAIRLRYVNTSGKAMQVQMRVMAADGSVMNDIILDFSSTAQGKWKTLTTGTGTSINAGNYRVVLVGKNAVGLGVSGIEVQ